jgi:hypothetical protein
VPVAVVCFAPLSQIANYATAKIKETLLAVTGR